MATNGLGYYTWKGLPPEVKALGEYDGELWRAVYNAAVEQHRALPDQVAWAAVTGKTTPVRDAMKLPMPVFSWLPMSKRRQLDNDSHDSSQGGRDREPADVDNPNAVSPQMAEAAGQGFNTTDPEEDTPEAHDGNPFGPKPTTDVADYNNEMAIARGNKRPIAKPQGPNPPAAL